MMTIALGKCVVTTIGIANLFVTPVWAKQSDAIEELVLNATAVDMGNRIASGCIDRGWSIVERSEYTVVCADRELSWVLTGQRTQDFARFNLIQLDGAVRIAGEGERRVTDRRGHTSRAMGLAAKGSLEDEMRLLLAELAA